VIDFIGGPRAESAEEAEGTGEAEFAENEVGFGFVGAFGFSALPWLEFCALREDKCDAYAFSIASDDAGLNADAMFGVFIGCAFFDEDERDDFALLPRAVGLDEEARRADVADIVATG